MMWMAIASAAIEIIVRSFRITSKLMKMEMGPAMLAIFVLLTVRRTPTVMSAAGSLTIVLRSRMPIS